MKRYPHSAIILLAALAFAGCSKTEEFEHNPDNALQIESVSGISPFDLMQNQASKAVITGNSLPGDEAAKGIGLFVTASNGGAYDGHDSGYTNVKYTFDGSKWSTQSPIYLSNNDGKLYGYFPYNADATDLRAIPVESSLNDTDYLYAKSQTVSHSNKSVSLQMQHALSRLHLTIKKGANFTADASLSKITLKSAAIDANGTLDLTTGVITASKKSGEIGIVELVTDGEITAQGIEKDILLVPADNSEGKKDIAIILLIGGKSAGITLSGENGIDIRSGIQNNVILTIEDTGIKVSGVGVDVWNEGGSQQVQVGGHTVTVKLADDPGFADDVWVSAMVVDDGVAVMAYTRSQEYLKCILPGGELCYPETFTKQFSFFVLPKITSDMTITIEYAKPVNVIISVVPENAGYVEMEGNCYEGGTITFTAFANGGRHFSEWQDEDGNTLSRNTIHKVKLTSDLTLKAVISEVGEMVGVFNIGTGKVHFSQGNLRCINGVWSFEDTQYSYTNPGGNNWGLFGWSGKNADYGRKTEFQNYDVYGTLPFNDWGKVFGEGSVWSTLSKNEWNALLGNHTYSKATVAGVIGLILLPEDWEQPADIKEITGPANDFSTYSFNKDEFLRMEYNRAVFLPCAGRRHQDKIQDNYRNYGQYWTSTKHETNSNWAYELEISGDNNVEVKGLAVSYGCSVRLVRRL